MIVYDVATNVLDTEKFPQQTIADLNSDIAFIVLFSQGKLLRWKEINTRTHTAEQYELNLFVSNGSPGLTGNGYSYQRKIGMNTLFKYL